MFPHKGAYPPMGAPNLVPPNLVGDNSQWISQSAYQNIDLDKVDWAVLAQQWIHMKESCSDEPSLPCVPPPPRYSNTIVDYEEQGEAPMEVEHEDEQTAPHPTNENIVNVSAPPPPANIFQSSTNNWNSESNSNRSQSHQKHWNRKGNRWNSSKSHRIPGPDGNRDGLYPGQVFNNAKQTMVNVWSTPPPAVTATNVPPFMHTNDPLKMHGMDAKSGIQLEQIGLNATPTLDAAQRKTLPAWIRDGLEKMEREKLKQAERDREMKERDEKRRQEKLIEQNLLMKLNVNESSSKLPAKSKFESDSESDNDDMVNSDYSENMARKAKLVTGSGIENERTATVGSSATSFEHSTYKPHRTKAEILTEIMLSVRKNLTEILLEVTNEEIYAIAQESLSKVRTSKGRKAQSVQKNALTAITPALGLVGYDDSDASKSSDDSDSDDKNEQNGSDNDSDIEIKRTIQKRKAAFEIKSKDIETYLADVEEREKQWLEKDDSIKVDESKSSYSHLAMPVVNNPAKSNENHETQRETPKMPNASKLERKGSRFSDVKSLVYNVANSQMANTTASIVRQNSSECKSTLSIESKKYDNDKKDSDDSDSSRKRSKYSSSMSSSHHRNKRERSHSPSSSRRHNKSSRRRSSSSSSDRSSYSRHSDRSRKHSRRERSSSDDRTSKSSQGSHKHDKYSREKSYSRSHSYKRSRH